MNSNNSCSINKYTISIKNFRIRFIRHFTKYSNNFADIFIILSSALSLVICYLINKIQKINNIIQF